MSKVLYFSAEWCNPCRAMKPIVEDFEQSYTDPVIIKVDADEEFELAREFSVSSIPTFILLSDEEEEVRRHKGVLNQSKFAAFALGE